ncbi:hypothetical protein CRYUN_Cryun02cG0001600 [Craigia yunnanensis]
MEITIIQPLIAVLISSLIVIRSYTRKSLDLSGALSGFIVFTIHFAVGYRFGAMLLAFFFTSSKLTKVGEEKKRQVDADFKEGGQRNWVIPNFFISGYKFYSIVPVRRGTNGGVTKTGLLTALAAGSDTGLMFVIVGFFTTRCSNGMAVKQLLEGLLGSIIDSLLGATLQFIGFCTVRNKVVGKPGPTVKKISGLSILDNNAVNLVSILLTTLITSIACVYIF